MSTNESNRERIDPARVDGEVVYPDEFDLALGVALHDVPVPAGLAERLIAVAAKDAAPVVALPKRSPFSRRRIFVATGSLVLAAVVAVSAVMYRQPERVVTQQDLGGEVAAWLSKLPAKDWRPATAALPKGVTLDPAVTRQMVQWQAFQHAGNSGWSGGVTAIDIAPAGRPRAMVFVVQTHAATRFEVPSAPTLGTRLGLSRGFVATAWQPSPKVLYVLVVEEDGGQRLEDYLRKRPQA